MVCLNRRGPRCVVKAGFRASGLLIRSNSYIRRSHLRSLDLSPAYSPPPHVHLLFMVLASSGVRIAVSSEQQQLHRYSVEKPRRNSRAERAMESDRGAIAIAMCNLHSFLISQFQFLYSRSHPRSHCTAAAHLRMNSPRRTLLPYRVCGDNKHVGDETGIGAGCPCPLAFGSQVRGAQTHVCT